MTFVDEAGNPTPASSYLRMRPPKTTQTLLLAGAILCFLLALALLLNVL